MLAIIRFFETRNLSVSSNGFQGASFGNRLDTRAGYRSNYIVVFGRYIKRMVAAIRCVCGLFCRSAACKGIAEDPVCRQIFVSIKICTVRIAELTGCGLDRTDKGSAYLSGKSLKLNFVMNAILTMSSIIFPLITFRYVSNILLPDGTGKVSFAISLITYFNMFAQLGIPIYGIRICAMVRDNKEELTRTAHELLVLNFIVGAVSYFVLLLAILFVPKLQEDRALYIIVSSTIFLSAIGMEWLYKALEQYTYIAIRSIIFKLIAMVGMFLLIHQKSDYVVYGGITVFASSAANIINLFHARKYIGFHSVGYYSIHRHLKPVLIFFAMSCATTIYTNLDNVMLGIMATKDTGRLLRCSCKGEGHFSQLSYIAWHGSVTARLVLR